MTCSVCHIYKSDVKSVLSYGNETRKIATEIRNGVRTFIESCLRCILEIKCHDKIRNEELCERAWQVGIDLLSKKLVWGNRDGLGTPSETISLDRFRNGTYRIKKDRG